MSLLTKLLISLTMSFILLALGVYLFPPIGERHALFAVTDFFFSFFSLIVAEEILRVTEEGN